MPWRDRVLAEGQDSFRLWSERFLDSRSAEDSLKHLDDRLFRELDEVAQNPRATIRDINKLRDFFGRSDGTASTPEDLSSKESVANFDILAWYTSFRHSGAWGIFIREAGVARLGDELSELTGQGKGECDFFAFKKLYLHEYCHFLFDVGIAMLEQLSDQPLSSAHEAVKDATLGWNPREEALCNAFAVRTLNESSLKASIKEVLRSAPPGYREFGSFLKSADFYRGVQDVFAEVITRAGGPIHSAIGTQLLFDDAGRHVTPRDIPFYLVPEPGDADLVYLHLVALGEIRESKRFKKQISKSPDRVQKAWHAKKPLLEIDIESAGGNFKSLTGNLRGTYRVELGGGWRATLEKIDGEWWATQVADHDHIYRAR